MAFYYQFIPKMPNIPEIRPYNAMTWLDFVSTASSLDEFYSNIPLGVRAWKNRTSITGDQTPTQTWLYESILVYASRGVIRKHELESFFKLSLSAWPSKAIVDCASVPALVMRAAQVSYSRDHFAGHKTTNPRMVWKHQIHMVCTMLVPVMLNVATSVVSAECDAEVTPAQRQSHQMTRRRILDKSTWSRVSDDGRWVHESGIQYDEEDHGNLLPWDYFDDGSDTEEDDDDDDKSGGVNVSERKPTSTTENQRWLVSSAPK